MGDNENSSITLVYLVLNFKRPIYVFLTKTDEFEVIEAKCGVGNVQKQKDKTIKI